MYTSPRLIILALASGLLAAPATATATERPEDAQAAFSVQWENDFFAGSGKDQHYTNGFRAAWQSGESDIPDWIEDGANLLPFFAQEGHKRYGFALGQNMYTPSDISRRDLIRDDRPYAGWAYGSVSLLSDTGARYDNLELALGVVGPAAGAEPVQDAVHDLINSPKAHGWDHQLDNEPGVVLSYERHWRGLLEYSPFGFGVDITPRVGGSLGNIYTNASAGAMVRIGYDLPADYGPPRIRPSLAGSDYFVPTQQLGGYLFAGVDGRAVARNIFLDGNTFGDSHSVDKEILTTSLQMGVAVTYMSTRLAFSYIMMSPEFDEQSGYDRFGAITLTSRF